jgi:hypothetical protein
LPVCFSSQASSAVFGETRSAPSARQEISTVGAGPPRTAIEIGTKAIGASTRRAAACRPVMPDAPGGKLNSGKPTLSTATPVSCS